MKVLSYFSLLSNLLCFVMSQAVTITTSQHGDVTTAGAASTACPTITSYYDNSTSVYGNSTNVPYTATSEVNYSNCRPAPVTKPAFVYPSFSLYSQLELITSSVVLSIFSAFGTVGNLVSIYVYFPRGKQSNLYVFYLSIIDFIMSFIIIPITIIYLFYPLTIPLPLLLLFAIGLVLIVLQSLEILVFISVDRLVACTFPQMYRKMQRYAKFVIVGQILVNGGILVIGVMPATSASFTIICQVMITSAFFIMVIIYTAIFLVLRKRMIKTLPQEHTMHSTMETQHATMTVAARTEVAETVIDPEEPEADGKQSVKEPIEEKKKRSAKTTKSKLQVSSRTRNLVATIRMFFAITIAFVVAYLPYYLISYKLAKLPRTFNYSLYLNHVSNPLIYFSLNKTYRDRARKLFNIIFPRCCSAPSTLT